jgi:HAD superfamily hydrolase (TIGR01490 family)
MSGYLALFDMDQTLVNVNTAARLVRWRHRHGRNSAADVLRVAYWLAKYKFGLLDAPRIAERVMNQLRNYPEAELQYDCVEWYRAEGRKYIVPEARRALERHRSDGAVLAVVTSATRYAVEPLAMDLCIPYVLCTDLEVDVLGRFTGRIIEPLCYGIGKVTRATQWAKSIGHSLAEAYFYTDSITDAPLLGSVAYPVAVNPDPRLRRLAQTKGWKIENWRS